VQTPLVAPAATAGQGDAPARLVVVSSNFAGQEFVLDKAAIVIGRTDENDIVVNHRSISRHHAKIVREGGHYHIVDLQSANGVRVNGDEYSKVELRKGDHIDLGHVRLRFVGPGEDFLFERDAQVVDVGGGRGSKMVLIGGGVLLIAAVIAVVVMVTKPPVATTGTEGTVSPTKTAASEAEVARLLLEADKAIKAEDWDSAIARCDEALKLDPTQDVAKDKRHKAASERGAARAFKNFLESAEKGDLDTAVASYGEIPEDSMYRQKGADRYATVKRGYVRTHLDAAIKARKVGNCEEAHQHVEAALTVDESNAEAQDIVRNCQLKVAGPKPASPPDHGPPKPPKPPVRVVEHPTSPPKSETGEDPGVTNVVAEKQLQEAQDAYVHGQYTKAIDDAKSAVKAQPSKAWRIIGASQCFLKNRDGATQAWNKLDAQGRQFLKYVCSRNAITVP
jgi:pSer/pThr/pTyr-binding forkhead associated (FHA) protein